MPPNGLMVFFAFFLLTGILIAIFLGEKFTTDTNPYRGVAVTQDAEAL